MSRISYLIAGLVTVVAVAAPTSAGMGVTKLKGTTGPGFTITLKKGTAKVKTLKAGKYAITVRDRSSSHDFHLVGPGVNRKTGVAFKGTVTWTVTLRKGVLRFRCDPHAAQMHGSVKVV